MGTSLKGNKSMAPCREACPAGIDVPRYIRHIREGQFAEALEVIRERIPFPFVCGYACVHPCETKCARLQFDEAVAIRMLKKVAAEKGGHKPARVAKHPPTGKRVAVIGSGPCGLTAAYYLTGQGHRVTVYEALPHPGGLLRYGIPEYRLPENIVVREIDAIRESGVEIIAGTPIASPASLKEKGFDAVFVATGAWKPVRMGILGENSPGVIDGLAFLRQVNEGKAPAIGRKVIVVGGGNTAIDAARASVRLGAEVVQLYRRTRVEMPAGSEEIAEACEEGVRIAYLAAPVKIETGRATCIRMRLAEPDATGRPAPVPLPGSEFTLPFDTLIMAIGQSADAASLHLEGEKNGTIRVEQGNLSTPQRGIFAGGDAVSGPSTIIEAIAQGRAASVSIDRFLGGTGNLPETLSKDPAVEPPEPAPRGTTRPATRTISRKRRSATFDPVELSYGTKAAMAEAVRCLSCDLCDFDVTINALICKDCGYCREVCSLGIFEQSPDFNPSGYKPAIAVGTDRCIGCLRCLYICPDFAITIQEKPYGG
ncbi:MAG: 4Fe-4S dicluster domain-containing protein [Deltaproteobacteria bacterium]|nr:4Fe-4S dicluster domain-containing protein [Deltaproteobacteria bacterium]